MSNKKQKLQKVKRVVQKPAFSRKDFRESPLLEQFYKTIYKHKLREQAYKNLIEMVLDKKNHFL